MSPTDDHDQALALLRAKLTGVPDGTPRNVTGSQTPKRGIRIRDDLWRLTVATAKASGMTTSDLVREALREYLARSRS